MTKRPSWVPDAKPPTFTVIFSAKSTGLSLLTLAKALRHRTHETSAALHALERRESGGAVERSRPKISVIGGTENLTYSLAPEVEESGEFLRGRIVAVGFGETKRVQLAGAWADEAEQVLDAVTDRDSCTAVDRAERH